MSVTSSVERHTPSCSLLGGGLIVRPQGGAVPRGWAPSAWLAASASPHFAARRLRATADSQARGRRETTTVSIAEPEPRVVALANEFLPVYDLSDAVAVVVDADVDATCRRCCAQT